MRRLSVLAVAAVASAALAVPAAALGSFGFLPGAAGFSTAATKPNGTPATAAGSHPHAFTATVGLNTNAGESDGDLRDLTISMPPGFLVNPTAVSECNDTAFHTPRSTTKPGSLSGESCPRTSQVGVVKTVVGGTTRYFGLFNLVPPFGAPVAIGASPFGTPLVFVARMREGDVGFDLNLTDLPQGFDLQSLTLTIWGTPWWGDKERPAETHDPQRGDCLDEETGGSLASTCQVFGPGVPAPEASIKSFLTLPTTPCGSALSYAASARSWQGETATAGAADVPLVSCNKSLTRVKAQLMTSAAAARTGLRFTLFINDGGGILNPAGIARPAIKTAVASLPEGLTINPSLGAGLGTCVEADFARETATSEPGAGCPNSSKIGTVTLDGALGLVEPLQGSVYLATPHANPFGTLLAVYMLARSPRRGLMIKSQGKIEPDPRTGRLVATFDDLPRLLYTDFNLTLREGQRSALVSPLTCGTYAAGLEIASWAEPTSFRSEGSSFVIDRGEGGGPCPGGGPPFAPGLLAGSINPSAGVYTPFYLRMTRNDSEQEITSYSATFPPGLLGKLAGVGECPDAAIAAAASRSGRDELAAPSCPASSAIGRTIAGYGVGNSLAWAPGGLYLAGPYHGSPLSVVAVNAALVGPFDLGTVVVRQAVRIDPRTARVSLDAAGSDPIPHILAGIPLHLRDVRVYVDRPGFMVNPTSCDPMQVASQLGGAGADPFNLGDDSLAGSSQRYQVLNCSALGFKPKLALRLHGSAKHGGYPSLRATYRPRPGTANLAAVSVTLPKSIFLAQEHIDQVCTRVQFDAGACPPGSVYGHAKAVTPLLGEPLQGPVYLRSSKTTVPDLVADLRGRGIRIEVPARIDSKRGGIRATYEFLPDAPVDSFAMTLFGGKRGLLSNAENLCRGVHRANARFVAHSNATAILRPRLTAKCKRNSNRKAESPR